MLLRVSARRIPACLLIAVLLVAAAGIGKAAEGTRAEEPRTSQTIGAAIRISNGPKREISPVVAFNATDMEYFVVWEDWRETGHWPPTRMKDLYGRRIHANGSPVGPAFLVSRDADVNDDLSPAVAWNAARNEYLIVWVRYADWYATDEIYGRRMRGDGTFIEPAFRINTPIQYPDVSNPQVVWNSVDDQYLVMWEDYSDDEARILGQRLAPNGTPLSANFCISGLGATEPSNPAVAFDTTRTEYLVVWEDDRNYDTRRQDIYGRRIDADDTPLGKDFRVSGPKAVEGDWSPRVAWSSAQDQYLVVWNDERDATPSGPQRGTDIYGVLLKGSDGSRLGGDIRLVHPENNLDDTVGDLAWNPTSGNYFMTYDDESFDWMYGWDVYGQRISPAGRRSGNSFRIIPPKGSEEADLTDDTGGALAWNSVDNQYLVTWTDARRAGTPVFNLDTFARRVTG